MMDDPLRDAGTGSETEDLLPAEEEQLRKLRTLPALPEALEDQVVRALERSGFIRRPVPWLRAAVLALGAVLLLFGGWVAGRTFPNPLGHTLQGRFILLLEAGGAPAAQDHPHGSAEEERRVREYVAWAKGLRAPGRVIQGERLADSGRALDSGAAGDVAWAPAAGVVQGFFVVSAPDLTQAVEMARSCPHLRYGGRIEVRPIDTP
jgi:hypothetical protein